MKAEQAWQATLGQLQVEMPRAAYDTWVRNAEFVSHEDGSFIIGVPNAYARDWLESRLTSTVKRMLTGIMNRTVEVRFIVWQNQVETIDLLENYSPEDPPVRTVKHPNLNPRYSFDNFLVGASNRLAHAASLAVSEKPGLAYNPLFIYGGVGLGKTHLLHAIGNSCEKLNLQVLYISSEEFTNDLIFAIRSHQTQEFREKYRRVDVLLIDDIQFIAGKDSTQEEFFHTFNALHGANKQIVISSDKPPKALQTLEKRLCSRFEWGLTADIRHPDFETRLAILLSKAEKMNCRLENSHLETIARKVQSNIRELEGALTRVAAYAAFSGINMSPQVIETALEDLIPHKKDIHPEDVITLVAENFGVTEENILSRDRSQQVVIPRQVIMYLLREETNLSLPQIGELLGGRDHTTVMHGCEKITNLLERDDRLRSKVISVREKVFGRSKLSAIARP